MCKNLNIGIVLFLIIGLVMSGCIRKLNLYQGDKDEDETGRISVYGNTNIEI